MAHLKRRIAARLDPALGRLTEPRGSSRVWILLLFWLVQGTFIYIFYPLVPITYDAGPAWAQEWFEALITPQYAIGAGVALLVISILQALFLLPVRKPGLAAQGSTLWVTATLAALCGGLLLVGLVMLLGDAAWLIDEHLGLNLRQGSDDAVPLPLSPLWIVMLCLSWLLFTPLILAFLRKGEAESAMARLSSRLFLGTAIEVAAIIPLDLMVRRKTNCFCGQGTFIALTTCIGLGMLLAGPAAWLPLLARRRKRWYRGHCPRCDYDMRGSLQLECCPECGTGWRAGRAASP